MNADIMFGDHIRVIFISILLGGVVLYIWANAVDLIRKRKQNGKGRKRQ